MFESAILLPSSVCQRACTMSAKLVHHGLHGHSHPAGASASSLRLKVQLRQCATARGGQGVSGSKQYYILVDSVKILFMSYE